MIKEPTNDHNVSNPEAGFSLLEMVVAMLIFVMISGSMFAILELGRSDRNRTSRRGDTQKNARIAMYLIGRDVMNAGLGYHKTGAQVPDDFLPNRIGAANDVGATRDMLTSVSGGNNVFPNKFLPADQKTDSIAFIYRDLDFNLGKPIVISDEIGSGTQVVLQTNAADFANANNNDLFIAETKTSQIVGIVTSKGGGNTLNVDSIDNLGLNQPRSLMSAGPSPKPIGNLLRKCTSGTDENCTTYTATVGGGIVIKKIEMVSYQVSNDGTLVRTIYGNNKDGAANDQIQQRAIAYGVQNFQLSYQMKDGTVVDDPIAGDDGIRGTSDDTPLRMNDLRYVSIVLTVSSVELDEYGKSEVVTLNSTFSLRNMGYDDK